MLVPNSVRGIGAVAFFVAVTIDSLTYIIAIIAVAIDAHRAGVGILIVSIIYISLTDIILNGVVAFLLAFSSRMFDLFAIATLTERARAKLLSTTGCFAHRAVIDVKFEQSGTMRFSHNERIR